MTTIDAGTRVGRYLIQELGGMVYKPLGDVHWTPGIIFSSALISGAWGYLVFGGSISSIWPLFGLSNQLLASMTLAVGTTVLFRMGKQRYAWTTLAPLCFMIATAATSGFYNIFLLYLPKGQMLLAGASAVMMCLIVFVIVNSVKSWFDIAKTNKELGKSL